MLSRLVSWLVCNPVQVLAGVGEAQVKSGPDEQLAASRDLSTDHPERHPGGVPLSSLARLESLAANLARSALFRHRRRPRTDELGRAQREPSGGRWRVKPGDRAAEES